jgi:hypothetical protein
VTSALNLALVILALSIRAASISTAHFAEFSNERHHTTVVIRAESLPGPPEFQFGNETTNISFC